MLTARSATQAFTKKNDFRATPASLPSYTITIMKKYAIAAIVAYAVTPVVVALFFSANEKSNSYDSFLGPAGTAWNFTPSGPVMIEPGYGSYGLQQPRRGANWVTFGSSGTGKSVQVVLDGRVEPTYAGKLRFETDKGTWESVCADVKSPIFTGQSFPVKPESSIRHGGNIAKAGRIVAKYFNSARTPEQCAGLQIAVWTAIEDGSKKPDFVAGRFHVEADPVSLKYAAKYYQAANEKSPACERFGKAGVAAPPEKQQGNANLMETGPNGGQAQLSPAPAAPKTSASVS